MSLWNFVAALAEWAGRGLLLAAAETVSQAGTLGSGFHYTEGDLPAEGLRWSQQLQQERDKDPRPAEPTML